jgi:PAS domain S-box-containing protein
MKLGILSEWLSLIQNNNGEGYDDRATEIKKFTPEKRLCERDYVILDMLNSTPESVSFCITDPHQSDNPVIFISSGFTKLTGYEFNDIVGKNCRFLQGEETSPNDVKWISDALKSEKECSVNLLNYKKDGTKFVNEVSSIYYCHSVTSNNIGCRVSFSCLSTIKTCILLSAQNKKQQFFLTQLRTPNQELAYFIGIQTAVEKEGPGQMPSNPGWVYTLGNHV